MKFINYIAALACAFALSGCCEFSAPEPCAFYADTYTLTFPEVKEAALQGDAEAQYALGYMYFYGNGVECNQREARFWINKAMANGHLAAMHAMQILCRLEREHGCGYCADGFSCTRHLESSSFFLFAPHRYGYNKCKRPIDHEQVPIIVHDTLPPPDLRKYNRRHVVVESQTIIDMASATQSNNYNKSHKPIVTAQNKEVIHTVRIESKQQANASWLPIFNAKNIAKNIAKISQPRPKARQLSQSERYLLSLPADHYTLQIIMTPHLDKIRQIVQSNQLEQNTVVYQKPDQSYVLVYGDFKTLDEAKAAANQLPEQLQKLVPWVMPLERIHLTIHAMMHPKKVLRSFSA